ncbi:hypothetical protein B296_00041376 [Ensete ventricosum]|uniref:Uncharacterized protein n=1 Tax=Ensete ventricosum TaxID=4639 RepID=A0A426Z9C3_ENSVE|nr:hypothetical protein B296_00041376 [Ensete ventricosum]
MALISSVKRVTYGSRSSSSFCLIPRRDAVVGFGRALARKLASNSLASWSKEWMKVSSSWLYHPRATPRRVIGKAQHIMASDVSYKAICTLNVTTCSVGSEPPSYGFSTERRKCYGMDNLRSLNKHQYCPGVREGPLFNAKMLLGDLSSLKGQRDVVRPASVRAAQRGAEPRDDAWGWLSLGHHDGGDLPPCRVVILLQEKIFTRGWSLPTRLLTAKLAL